jgi:hypothetical protein
MIPTDSQTRPREAYEPAEAPKQGVVANETDIAPSTDQTDDDSLGDVALRQSPSATPGRFLDGDDRPLSETIKDVSGGDPIIEAEDHAQKPTPNHTGSVVHVVEHTSNASCASTPST